MNRLLLLSVMLILLASACTSKCTIKGEANLNLLNGKNIYLKYLDDDLNWITLDSTEILHGSFELNHPQVSEPKLVTLFMDTTPLTPLILEAGDIDISISSSGLQIQGTPLNNRLYSFYKDNQRIEQSLQKRTHLSQAESFYESALRAHQNLIEDFMRSNQNNILGPTVYSIYYNQYPELLKDKNTQPIIGKMLNNPQYQEFEYEAEAIAQFSEEQGFLFW